MSKADLIIKLMREKGWSLDEAEEFLADVPDTPEREAPGNRSRQQWEAGDTVQVRKDNDQVTGRFLVAQRGTNGLTASQQLAQDRGLDLCPNCHENPHLPGCARAGDTPMNAKAVTKGVLPPAT